ncbi:MULTISPECIES: hypothetical protein [unclassified Psychrobacter]|uniref:hypothetical protein n=1 Tax=unclassified Psychrobacter TaxID=196806 RepID=UPI003FD5FFDA
MSTLIDELEARKNDYILALDLINLIVNSTNSTTHEVVSYLNIHNFEESIAVYHKVGRYSFEPYDDYSLGLLNEAHIAYFKKSDVMTFEPITKHGIFKNEIQAHKVAINARQSKAPPPPNHIKANVPFNQKTIGDVIEAEKQKEPILPNEYQRITMLYDYFTPHEAACFIAGLHPNFDGCNDGLEMGNSVVRGGVKSGKLIIDDDWNIKGDELKVFLHTKKWIMKGFNDDLSNDTDKNPVQVITETQTKPPSNDHIIKELAAANAKVRELESQLLKAELADKQAGSVILSNTDMQNVKKAAIKQFNRSLATVLIGLDYKDKLRKGDIANYIVPYMKELAFILADKDEKKAANLTVSYDTLYDTHLKNLDFKQGRQSNDDKNKVNIDLLFKKQLPVTE